MQSNIRSLLAGTLICLTSLAFLYPTTAQAFCGFFVAKADTKLFNEASQVVLVRDEDKTVLTMASDYQGDARDFAMVIPVPTLIEEGQINVANMALIDHLDAYTAPRLVEYFDDDPCALLHYRNKLMTTNLTVESAGAMRMQEDAEQLGVTIEASYTVGEYDILILSAKESNGLITWLNQNDYKVPDGAERVVNSYLKRDMKFFVAKVNLDEYDKLGSNKLRPLQVAYESPKFMLPIRLGMVNAKGEQELFVYALTRTGRVETTNYRTVKLPTGDEIPPFVKEDFSEFYKDMFTTQVKKERGEAVFLEYAWDMGWCDPCAADPLSREQLGELGVFWLLTPEMAMKKAEDDIRKLPPIDFSANDTSPEAVQAMQQRLQKIQQLRNQARYQNPRAVDVFVTRLHVRYDGEHFPEDLQFQETGDRTNFQGRYVMRHPFKGEAKCAAANEYFSNLTQRQEQEAKALANLTGWDINDIREKQPDTERKVWIDMPKNPIEPKPVPYDDQSKKKWWQYLWPSRND